MNKRFRRIAPVAAALAVAGVVSVASAATLGGLNSDQLGADDSVVAACDTDGIDVAYTTAYDAAAKRYEVSTVELSDIDAACAGQTLSVTVADAAGAALASASLSVAGTSESVNVASGNAAAEAVEHIAVVISG